MRTLLLLRGAPGCGKSSWIETNCLQRYTLCADDIRMLCASPSLTVSGETAIDQTNDTLVWKILFQLLETRMQNGEFTVIDATNSKTSEMNRYKALCDQYRYRIFCVDMTDVPIDVCKQRNAARPPFKRVPDAAIDKMYARFATQKIPSGITVIGPDELDRVFFHKIDLSDYDRIHVIGDIHGCDTVLGKFMDEVSFGVEPTNDFFIFTGDYTDRGVENYEVLERLTKMTDDDNVLFLEGNHELWLWKWANDEVTPSKEFELVTKTELESHGLDKKLIRKFYRRLGQCAWFDYHGKEFFVNHAGVSNLPVNPTMLATKQLIHGVGKYNDHEAVEEAWVRNTRDNCYQIHGHRNTKDLPVKANERVYNLEGRVEFGGCLRAVQIMPDEIKTVEIKNDVFRPAEEMFQYKYQAGQQRLSIPDIILEMRKSKFIQEKKYDNISSFNFTKSAFFRKEWDEMTTKARGLYINIPKAKIVARAYDKFFNIGERDETKLENLQSKLAFPAHAYVKENGFLGIVAYNEETDDLLITTKSSPEGDFSQWLREDLYENLGEETMECIKAYSKEHNVSFVFECIDMVRDPHIIEYPVKSKVVLLDIVYNEIPFRKMPFDEMTAVADQFSIPHKELAYTLESWQEFFEWHNQVTADDYQYNGREIEGFVIEGANGYMVKLKLAYYKFWKFMRSIAYETIRHGYVSKDKLAGLQSARGNFFYGWLKEYREQLLAANDDPDMDKREILSQIPTDIITLRRMFLDSGYMNEHH